MQDGKYDSALSVTAIRHFFWMDGKPNYPLNDKPRSQDILPIYNETNVFLFNREVALQGINTGDKPYLFEVDEIEAVDINYPIDFIVAKEL
jgi:CMP-N-acetylneuraminic acid synthetase